MCRSVDTEVHTVEGLAGGVVHEDVGCPDEGGRHADIRDVAILGLIPPEVVINPLLGR